MCVNSIAPLLSIPELGREIFQYLSPKDLSNCEKVCRDWKIISRDNFLWAAIARRIRYPFDSQNMTNLENGALRLKVKAFVLNLKKDFHFFHYIDEDIQKIINETNPPLESQVVRLKNYYDDHYDPIAICYIKDGETKEEQENIKGLLRAFY